MIVILEFFRQAPDDEGRGIVETEKLHFETIEVAISYALGAVNNVTFDGSMADGCLIKDRNGAFICEVRRNVGQS